MAKHKEKPFRMEVTMPDNAPKWMKDMAKKQREGARVKINYFTMPRKGK